MKKYINSFCYGFVVLLCLVNMAYAQSVTISPGYSEASLRANSTNNGVIVPQISLTASLAAASPVGNPTEGLLIYNTGNNQAKGFYYWTGYAWQSLGDVSALNANAPISIVSNTIKLNAGTAQGQLLSWDNNNWVNTGPKPIADLDNHQPYLALNFCIATQGLFPQRDDLNAFIGEITIYPYNFAPKSWFPCDGQLISISQNTALFALLGTYYGGNGQTTFALPDLRGRVPMHMGQGAGLSDYSMGEQGGEEKHTVDNKY